MRRAGIGVGAAVGAALALSLLAVLGIMWAAGVGIFAAHARATVAKKTLNARITTAILTPENAIANYERFFDECRSVVSLNEQIRQLASRYATLAAAAKSNDPFGQKATAAADALADLTGARNQRTNVAQTYNSQSAQYTRNQFKDARLPYRIEPPYVDVQCG